MLDKEKVHTWRKYLAKAARRMTERDHARERLEEQVAQLRKIDAPGVRKQLEQVQARLVEALEREKRLRKHHDDEQKFHDELKGRAHELESKIQKFLSTREQRLERIAQLEKKIAERLTDRNEHLGMLSKDLERLETQAGELKGKRAQQMLHRIRQAKQRASARAA